MRLPLFPLELFVLPGGLNKLRIFEPRYLRLVKIATKGQGFVILSMSKNNNSNNYTWGSWVEIINFDQSKEGILEIDVKCNSLVEILSVTTEVDQLSFGDVIRIDHWSQHKTERCTSNLSKSLETLFNSEPFLNQLYPEKMIANPNWVIARWLELLPINIDIKNNFIDTRSFNAAKNFVQSIIIK